ncbi:MAG: hypothetical protein RL220_1281 [Bacteroidota bacterium]
MFGMARDIAGMAWVELEISQMPVTVKFLKQSLLQKFPGLSSLLTYEIAVNLEYAQDSQVLNPQDELAVIPPVSGG